MSEALPTLEGVEPTRDTLQAYSRILSAVRRAGVAAHPRWWHISLQVVPSGLTTGAIPAPGPGGGLELGLDFAAHRLEVACAGREPRRLDLAAAPPADELGERVLEELASLGVGLEVDRAHWSDGAARTYRAAAAADLHQAFAFSADVFAEVRAALPGDRGPVQLWPHHFDLSFEWFGTLAAPPGEGGSNDEARAQIGFGFSTGDEDHPAPYYYANPWPFAAELTEAPLPAPARWHQEGWQGGLLPWAAVREGGRPLLARFLRAVHDAAAPRLTAIS